MTFLTELLGMMIASFIACTTFSALYHCPKNQVKFAGIVGVFGWAIYITLTYFGLDTVMSSFFACIGLCVFARVLSYARKAPVMVFLIIGVWPIVPGTMIYNVGYNVFMGYTDRAAAIGYETLQIAVALALGMGIVLSLPGGLFCYRKKETK